LKIGTGAKLITSHIYLSILSEIWYKGPEDTADDHLWVFAKIGTGKGALF
jgi:hypothetical protein